MIRETEPQTIRCAIYTRKSTSEGLEQEFNSLDAQRESAEAFIASHRHEGWQCLETDYADGGFSGGDMDRPGLQRLMADIEAGLIDCIVVYKVDRLSRSRLDFARIMKTFEKNGISFVSVIQQFNTTNSMGRLTLNILLSFAQFGRETISERTRDKMGAARRKGKFSGGPPVLGFYIVESKLVVNQAELARLGHVSRARITQIMNLLHLAPDIQEELLYLPLVEKGRDPVMERDLRQIVVVAGWRKQRQIWGDCPREFNAVSLLATIISSYESRN